MQQGTAAIPANMQYKHEHWVEMEDNKSESLGKDNWEVSLFKGSRKKNSWILLHSILLLSIFSSIY